MANERHMQSTELFKQFCGNPGFKKWLSDTVFGVTYQV
jgi:type I restriction enzyme R subunit